MFCISDETKMPDCSEIYPSLSHHSECQTPINKQVDTDGHSQSGRILDNLDNDTEDFPFVPPSTKDSESDIEVRPDFFHFLFYCPSRPKFLKIEKKEIFFFVFPSEYCTGVQLCFLRFVYSTAARLI